MKERSNFWYHAVFQSIHAFAPDLVTFDSPLRPLGPGNSSVLHAGQQAQQPTAETHVSPQIHRMQRSAAAQ